MPSPFIDVIKPIQEACTKYHLYNTELDPFQSYRGKRIKKGHFAYIPGHRSTADCLQVTMAAFTRYKGRKPRTFLDLGSGKGGALLIAKALGLEPTGVELNPDYIKLADRIMELELVKGSRGIKTLKGDILKWVPDQEYDIIYFFRPLACEDLWNQFLRHVATTFPKGQVVASFYSMTSAPYFHALPAQRQYRGWNGAYRIDNDTPPDLTKAWSVTVNGREYHVNRRPNTKQILLSRSCKFEMGDLEWDSQKLEFTGKLIEI